MTFNIYSVTDTLEKQEICREVLYSLPDWFGIPDATENYIKETEKEVVLGAKLEDKVIGFISIKVHNPNSAEVSVMGIKEEFHRHGLGRQLVNAAENLLVEQKISYLTVKTLAATRECPEYARTRAFYNGIGFTELEILTELWGEDNPCAYMVKTL